MNQLLKLLIAILIFASTGVYAQCPENIGFEDGTFRNWKAYVGDISRTGVVTINETIQPAYPRHEIISASAQSLDPFGHFPTVSPNGSKYAVRLGDSDIGGRVDRLTYTFTVPQAAQYGLVLNYAVVLQNPEDHGDGEQPRLTVKAFNVTDNKDIDCPAFDFIAASGLPGFKLSDVVTNRPMQNGNPDVTSIFYKDWASTTINLFGYAGKTISLIFTVNDCTRGGHFGYAYFDVNEQCSSPITGNTYCEGQTTVSLRGPRGFSKYKWYKKEDMNTLLDTAQTLRISPAPAVGTEYGLVIDALPGLGCPDTLYTTIGKVSTEFTFKVTPVRYFCPGTTFDLTAADVTTGTTAGLLPYEYYTDPVSEEYLRDPNKISKPGIYYIKAANADGCTNTLAVELKYYDAIALTITDPAPMQYPGTIDLSSTYVKQPGYNYFFYSDDKATKPVDDYRNIGAAGKYYIKAVSASGCEKTAAVTIRITPPDPYAIIAPSAFTPNNDGINDLFSITIKGFVDFGTLSIYNRTGQFLYKTNKQGYNWDGNFGGRPLPAGTYYWLFEGMDGYYHTKFSKGGYVSIIK